MKAVVLYHPNSEHSGRIEDYVTEFERYKNRKLTKLSLETLEGAELAKLYEITRYPAIVVTSGDGSLLRLWQGEPLPLMDELSYYVPHEQEISSNHKERIIMPLPAATAVI